MMSNSLLSTDRTELLFCVSSSLNFYFIYTFLVKELNGPFCILKRFTPNQQTWDRLLYFLSSQYKIGRFLGHQPEIS